jgi:hypothetical protein
MQVSSPRLRYDAKVEQVYSNPKSFLYFLRRLLPHFDAEYSYCSYDMADFESEMVAVAAFGFHDDAPMIVNDYGTFRRVELQLTGGKCKKVLDSCELMEVRK